MVTKIDPVTADRGIEKFDTSVEGSSSQEIQTEEAALPVSKEVAAKYLDTACFCYLPVTSPIRRLSIYIVDHRWFDRVILILILANCLCLALADPTMDENSTQIESLELVFKIFTVLYTLEALLKMLRYGVFMSGDDSYFRSSWNIMDFILVSLGWVDFIPGANTSDFSVLRVLRVFRALRTITGFPSLRLIVQTVLKSMLAIIDHLLLTLFFFVFFSILGVQLFQGALHQRCFEIADDSLDTTRESLCRMGAKGSDDYACAPTQYCADYKDSLSYDIIGFDNFGQAFLTLFTVMTMEGWTDVVYATWQSLSYWTTPYFLLFVIIVSVFLVQLVTGIVFSAFEVSHSEETKKELARKAVFEAKQKKLEEVIKQKKEAANKGAKVYPLNKKEAEREVRESHTIPFSSGQVEGNVSVPVTAANAMTNRNSITVPQTLLDDGSEASESAQSHSQSSRSIVIPIIGSAGYTKPPLPVSSRFALPKLPLMAESADKDSLPSDGCENPVSADALSKGLTRQSALSAEGKSAGEKEKAEKTAKTATLSEGANNDKKPNSKNYGACRVVAARVYFSRIFPRFMIACIILNTIFMATDHYRQPKWWESTLLYANVVFTFIFFIEMVIALMALGCNYFKSKMLVFDMVIIFFSIVDIILMMSTDSRSGISALRSLRIVRIFRLTDKWPKMKKLISALASSLNSVASLVMLMLIFIFMFALVGNQLFALKMLDPESGETSINNFDSFDWSLVKTYQVMASENWNEILITMIYNNGYGSAVYLISMLMGGKFIIFTVLVAILLSNVDEDDDNAEIKEPSSVPSTQDLAPMNNADKSIDINKDVPLGEKTEGTYSRQTTEKMEVISRQTTEKMEVISRQTTENTEGGYSRQASSIPEKNDRVGKGLKYNPVGYSLLIFSPSNSFRALCVKLVNSFAFMLFITLFIMVSIISLMVAVNDSYYNGPATDLQSVCDIINIATTALFLLEATVRIIALGFAWNGPTSYLRAWDRCFDFFLVIVSISDIIISRLSSVELSYAKGLRAFRVLRPMIVVTRSENLANTLKHLARSVMKVATTLVFMMGVNFVSGILMINLFQGLYYQCEDDSGNVLPYDADTCSANSGEWVNPAYGNFDNIFYSVQTLFETTFSEMWPDLMQRGVDIAGEGKAPKQESSRYYSIVFILYNFIGTMVFPSLIMGSIVSVFITESKKEKKKVKNLVLFEDPVVTEPTSKWRHWCYTIVKKKYFPLVIELSVFLNTILLCTVHYKQDAIFDDVQNYGNGILGAIFFIEAVIKISAWGIKYFSSAFNKIDFIVVIAWIVQLILDAADVKLTMAFTFMRVFRLLRLFKLLKNSTRITRLLKTIIRSLPGVAGFSAIMCVTLLIFCLAGNSFFSRIPHGEFINVDANFDTIGIAIFTLFRMITGESWNGIMHECFPRDDCVESTVWPNEVNCGSWFALVYFPVFMLCGQFILLNVAISIVMDAWESDEDSTAAALEKKKAQPNINLA